MNSMLHVARYIGGEIFMTKWWGEIEDFMAFHHKM
jgi:hypothetical protein